MHAWKRALFTLALASPSAVAAGPAWAAPDCPAVGGLADVTGDGLPDLIGTVCRAGEVTHLAMVPGRPGGAPPGASIDLADALWAVRTAGGVLDPTAPQTPLALVDATGDGIADILVEGRGAVYLWRGGADLPRRVGVSGAASIFLHAAFASSVPRVTEGMDPSRAARLPDVDADGRPDLVLREVVADGNVASVNQLGARLHIYHGGRAWPELVDLARPTSVDFLAPVGIAFRCDMDDTGRVAGQPPPWIDRPGAPLQGSPAIFLPLAVREAMPEPPPVAPTAPTDPPTRAPTVATPTATGDPSTPTTVPTEPTATATPTAPKPGDDLQAKAFPPMRPEILGTCSAAVHDRYAVVFKDGLRYRTWHPATVPVDPSQPAGATCSFAHEHGDDPLQGSFTERPPFGYSSRMYGDFNMILAHEGFKVMVHAAEGEGRGAEAEWRITFHQGTAGLGRLRLPMHDMQIELRDSAGNRTEVRVQGDTGRLSPSSLEVPIGDRIVPDKKAAEQAAAQKRLYEVWYTTVMVGRGTALGATAFFAKPGLASRNAMTYFDPADMSKVLVTSELVESLPKGDARSAYLGNDHLIEHPDFVWGNLQGPEVFWTDAEGFLRTDVNGEPCTHLTCIEQQVPRIRHVDPDEVSNRIFERAIFDLPVGALGGN